MSVTNTGAIIDRPAARHDCHHETPTDMPEIETMREMKLERRPGKMIIRRSCVAKLRPQP